MDQGTGKTSLIRKYIHGVFKDEYEVTVGVDFSSKIVTINNEPVQLQIWDTVLMRQLSAVKIFISPLLQISSRERQLYFWSILWTIVLVFRV